MLKPLTSQMCASLNVSKKSHNKTKVSRESKKQRNKEAKKSSETDKQRTLNIKEAGTIGKRLFPCLWSVRPSVCPPGRELANKLQISSTSIQKSVITQHGLLSYHQIDRHQRTIIIHCLFHDGWP